MAVLAIGWIAAAAWVNWRDGSLRGRMAGLRSLHPSQLRDCAELVRNKPIVLLALGQSNAANHGLPPERLPAVVWVFEGGRCGLSSAPLPGATGGGGSPWPYLPGQLAAGGVERPVLLAVVAVDATTIDDWTRRFSPLRRRLAETLEELQRQELKPSMVLWQQGEADALRGTSTDAYKTMLAALAEQVGESGISAPLALALSTRCRSLPYEPVREAVLQLTRVDGRFIRGPDIDQVDDPVLRHDGCHFTDAGLQAVAREWAHLLAPQLRSINSGPGIGP